jgi:hypothetical protein
VVEFVVMAGASTYLFVLDRPNKGLNLGLVNAPFPDAVVLGAVLVALALLELPGLLSNSLVIDVATVVLIIGVYGLLSLVVVFDLK